jgi:hypothetical protein
MKARFFLLAILSILSCEPTFIVAQWIGGFHPSKGDYIEMTLNNCGCVGSSTYPPAAFGFHPTPFSVGFGLVGDVAKDGWNVAVSPMFDYCGDYIAYGTPIEGWGVTMNGNHYINTNFGCSTFNIPGAITFANSTVADDTTIWRGRISGLDVIQIWSVPQDEVFVTCTVMLINDTSYTQTGVYFGRNVDPDGEKPWAGTLASTNKVIRQPVAGVSDTAIVQAIGGTGVCHIYLATVDSRAIANHGGSATPNAQDLYLGTGRTTTLGVSSSGDEAIGMGFSLGDILPGDTATLSFAYVLDSLSLDVALARIGPPCTLSEDSLSMTVCGSYLFNGNLLTASGSYIDTLASVLSGCDSIVHLDLTVLPPASTSLTVTGCDSYNFNGATLTLSGSYTDTLTSLLSGCDSLVHLDLVINSSATNNLTVTACGSYEHDGTVLTTSGIHSIPYTTVHGCDSLLVIDLTLLPALDATVNLTAGTLSAAPGYTYQWVDCDAGFATIGGATAQEFTPVANGHFAVILSNGSCVDTSACTEVLLTSTHPIAGSLFTLSPNPVTNQLAITCSAPILQVEIRTLTGQVMWEGHALLRNEVVADLSSLSPGVYLVKVKTNEAVELQKVIKL